MLAAPNTITPVSAIDFFSLEIFIGAPIIYRLKIKSKSHTRFFLDMQAIEMPLLNYTMSTGNLWDMRHSLKVFERVPEEFE